MVVVEGMGKEEEEENCGESGGKASLERTVVQISQELGCNRWSSRNVTNQENNV